MAVSYNAKKSCKKLDLFFDCDGALKEKEVAKRLGR